MRKFAILLFVIIICCTAVVNSLMFRQGDSNVVQAARAEDLMSREESLEGLRKLHAQIGYDSSGGISQIWFQDVVALSDMGYEMRELSNDELRLVSAFPEVKHLSISGCSHITDQGLQHLEHLKQIEELDLSYTSITGRGLSYLIGNSRLRVINLIEVPLVDSDLRWLKRFPFTTRLYFCNASITDKGLAELASLTSLEELCVEKCPLSDDGVKILSEMNSLKKLYLGSIPLTDGCVDYFRSGTGLKTLVLRKTGITESGSLAIERNLESCVVNWK